MGFSFGHLLLLLVIVLIVFGAGKIPQIMGDVAKGVKAFKKGMNDSEIDDIEYKDVTPSDKTTSHTHAKKDD